LERHLAWVFSVAFFVLKRWSLMTLILCCWLLALSTGYCQRFVESWVFPSCRVV
jgi:hypothetical protein